jgi:hypothetical protein
MIIPAFASWLTGVAIAIALSILLRHLANDAQRLVISRRAASFPADPKRNPIFKKAA